MIHFQILSIYSFKCTLFSAYFIQIIESINKNQTYSVDFHRPYAYHFSKHLHFAVGFQVDRVIFVLFLEEDVTIYETLMQVYFPL